MKSTGFLGLILGVCMMLSLAEMLYIENSPLPSAVEPEALEMEMEMDLLGEAGFYTDSIYYTNDSMREYVDESNLMYQDLYRERPHEGDPYALYYKLYLTGTVLEDIMFMGNMLFGIGVFSIDHKPPWVLEYAPEDYICSFPGVAVNASQQARLIEAVRDIWSEGFPGIENATYTVKDDNTIEIAGEGINTSLEIEDDICSIKGWPIGRVVEVDGELKVYSISKQLMRTISRYGAAAIGSEYLPGIGVCRVNYRESFDWGAGRRLGVTPLGSLLLAEMVGGNSVAVFDERFPGGNVTHEEFLAGYSGLYKTTLARLSFVESVLDGAPWTGIYYAAYYPEYGKVWIIMKNIPEKELEEAVVRLDGGVVPSSVMPPFIYVDAGELGEGVHGVEVATPAKAYGTSLDVEYAPLRIICPGVMVMENGSVDLFVANVDRLNRSVTVETVALTCVRDRIDTVYTMDGIRQDVAQSSCGTVQVDVGKELKSFEGVSVSTLLDAKLYYGETVEADVAITYTIDGKRGEYREKIRVSVES